MIFGRKFLLQTDHKPLLKIFGSKNGIPVYTANRLQRWALTMLLYDFYIQFIPTASFGNADVLSRLMSCHSKPDEEYVIAALQTESDMKAILADSISSLPVTSDMISKETQDDLVLQVVINYIRNGWPNIEDQYELRLDLLKPCVQSPTLENKKQNAEFNRRHGVVKKSFDPDDLVYAQVHRRNTIDWIPGQVIERKGKVNYTVLLEHGRLIRAHTNQPKQRYPD
ncbi:uncharacterized protein LOC135707115 [Ochlerotatus camptorhynchus]|uniref:uncharacterized protein LOC135707115 n=1 Tax=Ochlerotatus camptorhynchus TaxID=644619 RepID=UPI0031D040B2